MAFAAEDRAKVIRGVLVTVLGSAGSACSKVFLFVAPFLFGRADFGLFMAAFLATELLSRFIYSGFADSAAYFGARHVAQQDDDGLYRALAVTIVWPLLISIVLGVAVGAAGPEVHRLWWSQHDPKIISMLRTLALAMPLSVLVRILPFAIKAHLEMKWIVLVLETALPLTNVALGVLLWLLGFDGRALAWAWLLAHALVLPLAVYAYARYFSLAKTLRALLHLRRAAHREVLHFAVPQSVSIMLYFGLARIDTLMLSHWLSASQVGLYGLLSEAAQMIRAARTAVAGIFAPLVARYQAVHNREGIQESFDTILGWVTGAATPLALVVLAFYPEVLLGPGSTWPMSPWIAWCLVLEPMFNCWLGLSGNTLLMLGHSRLILINTTFAILVNVVLNFLWIPTLGALGAAVATLMSGALYMIFMTVALRRFEGIELRRRLLVPPLCASVVPVAIAGASSSDAWITAAYGFGQVQGLALKLAAFAVAIVLYVAVLAYWPTPHPARDALRRALRRARGKA